MNNLLNVIEEYKKTIGEFPCNKYWSEKFENAYNADKQSNLPNKTRKQYALEIIEYKYLPVHIAFENIEEILRQFEIDILLENCKKCKLMNPLEARNEK